jgi:transcriptional regulator with XRE-family HTH domain
MRGRKPTRYYPETAFRRWRRSQNLTLAQAAARLGLCARQVVNLDHGQTSDGRPMVPRQATRQLMAAVAQGIVLEPWPLE